MSLEKINKAAYEVLSSMPEDEAKLVLSAIVYDTLPPYIEEQTPLIQKHVDAWISKRYTAYERYLKRQYVERVQKNEDTTDLEESYETISKAFQNTMWDTNPSEAMRLHPRDPKGRWRESPYKIVKPVTKKPISNPTKAGIPDFQYPKNFSGEKIAEMQSAYTQIKSTLGMYEKAGLGGEAQVRMFSPGARGQFGSTKIIAGTDVESHLKDLAESGRVPTDFVVAVPASASVGGTYFDALSSIPGVNSNAALSINTGGEALPANINSDSAFQSGWFSNDYALSDNEPRFRRLKSGAELVDSFVPASAMKTKAALAGAKYVGQLGPDAEKIIGPTTRKLTYRSRGTERKSIDSALKKINAADRQRAILGYDENIIRDGKLRSGGAPGTIVSHFIGKLPSKDYWELQRKSGAVPPSEGIVIDAGGKIVSQSVGFKDDHYLPFSLKALSKIRGGEYVRTRSTGGPTTEDIYTSLIGGATGFTVVSRSGVFTVDFDDSFHGRRRYNDKAGKMVERYGKLLDAAGSGEVTLKDVDPERNAEIVQQARDETTNISDYKARLNKLLEDEKFKPKPSTSMRAAVYDKVAMKVMEETVNGGTEFAARYTQLKANAKNAQLISPDTTPDVQPMLRATVDAEISNRINVALQEELAQRSFRAMKLDGDGYNAALQALKEQYPYYIANVKYRRFSNERDSGYVKPKFLRPDEVWEGYFDPSIKGSATPNSVSLNEQMFKPGHRAGRHGKIRASRSNYANFKVESAVENTSERAEEQKTSSPRTISEKAQESAVEINAKDRQIAALAAAYTASMGTKLGQNGVMAPMEISAQLKDLNIDVFDVTGSIRRRAAEDSTFLPALYSELNSHLQNVGAHALNTTASPELEQWRTSLKAYDREVAPKMEIPQDSNLGYLAIQKPDSILDFPDLKNASRVELNEDYQRPDVKRAIESLGDTVTSDAITARLKALSDPWMRANANKPPEVSTTEELQNIEKEGATLARLKALLHRESQLGDKAPDYGTTDKGVGLIIDQSLGSQ